MFKQVSNNSHFILRSCYISCYIEDKVSLILDPSETLASHFPIFSASSVPRGYEFGGSEFSEVSEIFSKGHSEFHENG